MSFNTIDSSRHLASRSHSGQGIHPKVVIVKANSSAIEYSNSPGPELSPHAKEEMRKMGYVTIKNDTVIEFSFNGTGIVVLGALHNKFPPVPLSYTPNWNCYVDDVNIANSTGHDSDSIPVDGNTKICGANSLLAGPHTLKISVQVTHLPAFFHSIRYLPLPTEYNTPSNNAILRIDRQDNSTINCSHGCRIHHESKMSKMDLNQEKGQVNITFHGSTLNWYGSNKKTVINGLQFTIDGKRYHLNSSTIDENELDYSPNFQVVVPAKHNNNMTEPHTLIISAPQNSTQLYLDHLEEIVGTPVRISPIAPPPPSGPPKAVLASSIIAGTIGMILSIILLIVLIRYRRKQRRKKMGTWKDTALPSAIVHPASRVSSRSSFSKEVVSGDIEYNPEAQKKMDELTTPPTAVLPHADSGRRNIRDSEIRILRTSEIPPQYTQL